MFRKIVSKKGTILFSAIGAIAILSILAVGATSAVMQELRFAKFVRDSTLPVFQAESVIRRMKVIWSYGVTLSSIFPTVISFGGDVANCEFRDEETRININTAPRSLLERLPGLYGQDKLLDRIAAGDFRFKEELLLLDGMTKDIYEELEDLVTTYGSGRVNINTAPDNIFVLLGMGGALIDRIHRFRAGDDGESLTDDDQAFSWPAQIVPELKNYGLSSMEEDLIESLVSSGQLGVGTDYVSSGIIIRKRNMPASKSIRSFFIVLNLSSGMIVQWTEM